MFTFLKAVHYKSPPWSTKYPKLAAMTTATAKYPEGNISFITIILSNIKHCESIA